MTSPPGAVGDLLDARDPTLAEIAAPASGGWSDLADRQRRFVALLDVPRLLPRQVDRPLAGPVRQLLRGRLPPVARRCADADGPAGPPVQPVPPSAFAAGIIADRERRLGLAWGPANELAAGAVRAGDGDRRRRARRLHLLGINVFRAERDGFRLTVGPHPVRATRTTASSASAG